MFIVRVEAPSLPRERKEAEGKVPSCGGPRPYSGAIEVEPLRSLLRDLLHVCGHLLARD